MLARIFVNGEERRLRAFWRLSLNAILMLLGLVFLGIVLAIVLIITGGIGRFEPGQFGLDDLSPLAMLLVGGVEILVIGGSVLFCGWLLDRRRLRDFGFRLDRGWWADFAFGLALGAALQMTVFWFELACGWIEVTGYAVPQENGGPFLLQIIAMLLFFAGVAFSEELLSRGYHLKNLAEGLAGVAGLGARGAILLAVLVASALFSGLHVFNENVAWWGIAGLALSGFLLATGMLLTGELAIPIGLHLTWNFVQGNVFGFPVSGQDAGPTLIAIRQGGPACLTGGAFGPEGGALGAAVEVVGIMLIVLWVRRRRGRAALHVALVEPELRHRPPNAA